MSFTVAQRTHEIGLRMALGAHRDHVLLLVLREGMLLALSGLGLGRGGASFVGRTMRAMSYGGTAVARMSIGAVAAVLILCATAACLVLARRAMRVDPMVARRYE